MEHFWLKHPKFRIFVIDGAFWSKYPKWGSSSGMEHFWPKRKWSFFHQNNLKIRNFALNGAYSIKTPLIQDFTQKWTFLTQAQIIRIFATKWGMFDLNTPNSGSPLKIGHLYTRAGWFSKTSACTDI